MTEKTAPPRSTWVRRVPLQLSREVQQASQRTRNSRAGTRSWPPRCCTRPTHSGASRERRRAGFWGIAGRNMALRRCPMPSRAGIHSQRRGSAREIRRRILPFDQDAARPRPRTMAGKEGQRSRRCRGRRRAGGRAALVPREWASRRGSSCQSDRTGTRRFLKGYATASPEEDRSAWAPRPWKTPRRVFGVEGRPRDRPCRMVPALGLEPR